MTKNSFFSWQKQGLIFASSGHYPWMISHNQKPCALVLEDRVRVYFACRTNPDQRGYFISVTSFVEVDRNNPQNLLYIHDRPVLNLGGLGAFDQFGIMPGIVLEIENEVWMYYVGWMRSEGVPYSAAIGLAISKDGGINFKRYAEGPIITRTPYEPFLQGSPTVAIISGKFHMWYSSGTKWLIDKERPEIIYVLMHAVSNDGINWKRDGNQCITSLVDNECQASPSVFYLDGLYHLWFCHRKGLDFRNEGGGYRIGYATSVDLVNWTRDDNASPLHLSESGWDSEMICYPFVFQNNTELLMLYSGNYFGRDGFGFASCNL